jgi:HAMP domain-containing protein
MYLQLWRCYYDQLRRAGYDNGALMKTFLRILPILICFLLVVGGVSYGFYAGQVSAQSSLDVSLERYVTTEGAVVDLRDTEDGEIWLRGMDSEGVVFGQVVLHSDDSDSSEALGYHILGFADGEVYLAESRRSLYFVTPIVQRIFAVDLTSNQLRELGVLPERDVSEIKRTLTSFGVADGSVYVVEMASAPDGGMVLQIRGMDVRSGKVTATQTINADFDVIWVNVAADGIVTAISTASDVYYYSEDTWNLLYDSEGSEALIEASVGADGSIYLFMADADTVIYRLQPGDAESVQKLHLEGADGASRLVCISDDTYIAKRSTKTLWEYSSTYAVTVAGETSFISAAQLPFSLLWANMHFSRWIIAMFVLLVLLAIALLIRLRAHISIITKQILAAVPAVIIGLALFLSANRCTTTETIYADRYLALGERATWVASLIDAERFAKIDWDKPESDPYYQEIKAAFDGLSGYSEVSWWQPSEEPIPFWDPATGVNADGSLHHSGLVAYRAYHVTEGIAYTALYDGVPVSLGATYLESTLSDMDIVSLLNENELPVHARVFDAEDEGYWLSFYAPLWHEESLVGFVEVSEPGLNIEVRVSRLNTLALMIAAVLMFVALSLVIFVLAFTLRRLGRLKSSAEAVAAGDYSVHVKANSRDEAGDIAKAFNIMAASVKESIEDITETSKGYSRFVPAELITALGKPSIREVAPGAHIDINASNLFVSTPSFVDHSNEDFFKMLNYYYETVIPPIVDSGGIIGHFSATSLSAIYEGGIASALDSAIATYAALDGFNLLLAEQGRSPIVCHALLGHSNILLGVAGTNQRLDIITVSPLGNRTEKIAQLGRICGCRLLVAQSAFEALGTNVTHYPYRWAGYVQVEDRWLRLYDFYFCEVPTLRRAKEQSKDTFERGVGLYYERRYQEASALFVQAVKIAPEDSLAKEYLYRCHTFEKAGQEPTELMVM